MKLFTLLSAIFALFAIHSLAPFMLKDEK